MYEKVNPCHPDKVADRIAGEIIVDYKEVPQDINLAYNQTDRIRCGDNGIFKGVPLTKEQKKLSKIAQSIYAKYHTDGKYILNGDRLIICQSNANKAEIQNEYQEAEINPIGDWTGGTDVDTGATNRKLGSDMADSVSGGGLHGKDLSKADVSVNIYAWLKAQETEVPVELCCAIGDEIIDGRPYSEIVEFARKYKELSAQYESEKNALDKALEKRAYMQSQEIKMKAYLEEIKKADNYLPKWSNDVWMLMVEKAIVNKDKNITFKFTSGTEVIL